MSRLWHAEEVERYEIARIRLYEQKWHKTIFAIHVIGPEDERWIEDPDATRIFNDKKYGVVDGGAHREVVNRLTRLLLKDGWEPLGKEDAWFAYTFRRKVPE